MNNTGGSSVLLLPVLFHKADTLIDDLALPGFSMAVREIFE
jgi:hypothetical protein